RRGPDARGGHPKSLSQSVARPPGTTKCPSGEQPRGRTGPGANQASGRFAPPRPGAWECSCRYNPPTGKPADPALLGARRPVPERSIPERGATNWSALGEATEWPV